MPSYSEVPTMDPKTGTITWVGDEPQQRGAQTRFGVQSLRLKKAEDLFDVVRGLNRQSSVGVSTEANDYLGLFPRAPGNHDWRRNFPLRPD